MLNDHNQSLFLCISPSLQGPSEDEVNCDKMKYYKIYYKKLESDSWQEGLASNLVSQQNISGLEFATEYKVMVAAINNMDLSSNSAMMTVTTVEDGEWIGRAGIGKVVDRAWEGKEGLDDGGHLHQEGL